MKMDRSFFRAKGDGAPLGTVPFGSFVKIAPKGTVPFGPFVKNEPNRTVPNGAFSVISVL